MAMFCCGLVETGKCLHAPVRVRNFARQ
jgi:hypothetical protein